MKVEKKVLIVAGGSREIGAVTSLKTLQAGYSVHVYYKNQVCKLNK